MTDSNKTINASDIQKKIASGQLDEALAELQIALTHDTTSPDVNYMAAVCYRYKNNYTEAQRYLDLLKDMSLDKGRVYQEQGHLYRAQNILTQALVAYQAACQLNPALIASWQAQSEILTSMGRPAAAQQATLQLQRLQNLPKVLVSVTDLIEQGKLFFF